MPPMDGNDVARRARALMARGEAAHAVALLEGAGVATSTSVAALLAWADALEAVGQGARAIDDLEAVAPRVPDPAPLIRAAGIAAAAKDRRRRDALLAEAARRFPRAPLVFAAQADAADEDDDTERHIAALARVIELADPAGPPPLEAVLTYNERLCRVGRPGEARAALERLDRAPATEALVHSARLATAHYDLEAPDAAPDERARALTDLAALHRRFGDRHGTPFATSCGARPPLPGRRVRVGYLSPDLRAHSVASFLLPILRAHDRARFDVRCYSTSQAPHDATTDAIAELATLVDLRGLAPAEAARRVAADGLDLAVDLAGHTAPHQLAILARRVAPLQLSVLGYPDGTGLPEMDGFVTDAVCSPPEADAYAVERLVRLPCAAWTFDPRAPDLDASRAPGGGVVFGAFHTPAKMSDAMLALWARVLDRVPGSTLATSVRTTTAASREALARRLAAAGADPARVRVLAPVRDRREHLERLRGVDVWLDTFPYAGTTTTCEALWMGVPAVTLAGATHVSRVGASLCAAVGLDDLVATTAGAYVEAAARIALDPGRRAALRRELRDRMRASTLGDGARFTRALEALYDEELARRAAEPGFALVASGEARLATVAGERVVLPAALRDPASFRAIEAARIDEGELARAIAATDGTRGAVDVAPGVGAAAIAMARAGREVAVIEPRPPRTLTATIADRPAIRLVSSRPGRTSGPGVVAVDDVAPADVGLVRVGAPGVEIEVLAGARRALEGGAVVLLERQLQPLGPAHAELAAMGLGTFALVPALDVVTSVGPGEARGTLFVLSPAARERFGASLGIVEPAAPAPPPPVDEDAARVVRDRRAGAPLPEGLAAFVASRTASLPMPDRLRFLRTSVAACSRALKDRPDHVGRRLSLCRALVEFGAIGAVAAMIQPLLPALDGPLERGLDEPFLAALPRYDALDDAPRAPWLRAQIVELFVKSSAPSSFFHPEGVLSLFALFDAQGFPDPEMDRREALLRSRASG
jgi:predicted O-linked N-acetylglucosamine transferase (SPINDLY family)